MEAIVFAERFLARARTLLRAQKPFRLCLCASLLLHGIVLMVSAAVSVPRGEAGVVAPLPALNVSLHRKTSRSEALSPPPSSVVVSASANVAANVTVPRGQPLRAAPARSPLPLQKDVDVPVEPEPHATPSLDLDDLKSQARSLAHSAPEPLVRGTGAHRNIAPVPVQDSLDRPILEALSRRLGKTLVVASEQRMSDGSWMIRFAGNTCLRIPQHLPEWQKNSMGATVLVPTNCAN